MPSLKDQYTNIASIQVVESAANTLTFKKLETGVNFFEKMAWLLSRIEYYLANVDAGTFNATGDLLSLALVSSNAVTSLSDLANPSIIDFLQVLRLDIGAAASGFFYTKPIVRSFEQVAGGGLLVPPNPLYLAAQGSGLTSATTNTVRIYYTSVKLTPDEYWELVEARRVVAS